MIAALHDGPLHGWTLEVPDAVSRKWQRLRFYRPDVGIAIYKQADELVPKGRQAFTYQFSANESHLVERKESTDGQASSQESPSQSNPPHFFQ